MGWLITGRDIGRGCLGAGSGGGAELVELIYAHSPVTVPFYESLGYDRRAIVFPKYLPTTSADGAGEIPGGTYAGVKRNEFREFHSAVSA